MEAEVGTVGHVAGRNRRRSFLRKRCYGGESQDDWGAEPPGLTAESGAEVETLSSTGSLKAFITRART